MRWPVSTALGILGALALSGAVQAGSVPQADHVRIDCTALRLAVNDYSVRHQLTVLVNVSATDESRFAGVEQAVLAVRNPAGQEVELTPRSYQFSPRKFKAAHGTLLFKAIEDSAAPETNTVPAGFFADAGPYHLRLDLRGERFGGGVSFGTPLGLSVEQGGLPVRNFSLKDEEPFAATTTPAEFGPVYYKHQDLANFVFQLANMDQALESGDYHTPVEPRLFYFQVRVGTASGGPTRLVDPARYIEGYTPHLIRSEWTATPLTFQAEEFSPGEIVLIDFSRHDTLPPDTDFTGPGNFSSQVVVEDRVVYALHVETAPTPEELGQALAEPQQ